jgi:hypothetical protein
LMSLMMPPRFAVTARKAGHLTLAATMAMWPYLVAIVHWIAPIRRLAVSQPFRLA